MQLVDTHCHLDFKDYKDDFDEVLQRAAKSDVVRIIVPGTNLESSKNAIELSQKYPSIFAGVGIHPHEADKVNKEDMDVIRNMAISNDKVVAIGEVGLDYYRKYSEAENQKKLFFDFLVLAKELDLPVILHNRSAEKDFIDILKRDCFSGLQGVVHCFSSNDESFLKELLDLGMYISFTGNITFDKAGDLRDMIKIIPPERILLETDAPYITPEPFRGKRNEPAFVRHLLDVYKKIYGLSGEDIARITTHNANHLFSLGIEEQSCVVYPIRDSLYLNITNRCTNRCTFCTRENSDYVKGHKLNLLAEPSVGEILEAMGDIETYKEIVFCGYGEPTLRLDVIKEVASVIKEKGANVRLTTNGEGNRINGRKIAFELKGLVDRVSVSLNAQNPETFQEICNSVFGKDVYEDILEFIGDCKNQGIEVEITCLDINEEIIAGCKEVARRLGVNFRQRHLDVVG